MTTFSKNINHSLWLIAIAGLLPALAGCSFTGGPRGRWGFTPQVGYGNPDRLGTHSYGFGGSEGYGIFYTLRGGSIDLDHVRGTADLTRWAYVRAYDTLRKGKGGFTVSPNFEWTTNKIKIQYPIGWKQLSQAERDKLAREAALIIAPTVGYNSMIWHEMLTWKGTHFMLFEPEFTSAFSWDDLYSDLTGSLMAIQAIKEGNVATGDYNRAMTALIQKEFQTLHVVPKQKAIAITESVRGTWHGSGKLMKRNMDTGYDDGQVTPALIPGYTDEPPISKPMPTFDGLQEFGITVKYTVSSTYFENGKLKKIAGTKSAVEPVKHFPTIMKNIEQEAIQKYGYMIR
ncbi:MAG: DUF4056 domain-containing protein [Phycisphaerae bacterium]|nr:DUF4056 domain-containing protein [Phycisphaerae bacterium]